jgi:WS/DGAT/MGAT family acyltransferase
MSDTETLMWLSERDPRLRSSFMTVTMLDRAPDFDRFRTRMEAATHKIDRLRQRVVEPALGVGPPEWADDPDFDLDYHLRRVALPGPGTERQLLDLGALLFQDAFDPTRPLWQYTVVEGVEDGRAALLAKMHHTISDGIGALRLSAMFVDLERAPAEDDAPTEPAPSEQPANDARAPALLESLSQASLAALRGPVNLGRRTLSTFVHTMSQPLSLPKEAVGAVQSTQAALRQVRTTESSHSPLWAGRRSMGRRFEVFSLDLEAAKAAAKALGATLNDLYVAGILGGASAYHRLLGAPVLSLRAAIPISTRTDRSAGGNAFLPTRMLLPANIEDPVERLAAVHARMSEAKSERLTGIADALAGVVALLPASVVIRLAQSQVETVDFAASNLRGAPFPLYIAGALIIASYPIGPTGGTAFNASLLSYQDSMDIGVDIDTGAVSDPDLLRTCLISALNEQVSAAP